MEEKEIVFSLCSWHYHLRLVSHGLSWHLLRIVTRKKQCHEDVRFRSRGRASSRWCWPTIVVVSCICLLRGSVKKLYVNMEESMVLWMLALVMLIGSYLAGSLPLVINLSEVSFYLTFNVQQASLKCSLLLIVFLIFLINFSSFICKQQ